MKLNFNKQPYIIQCIIDINLYYDKNTNVSSLKEYLETCEYVDSLDAIELWVKNMNKEDYYTFIHGDTKWLLIADTGPKNTVELFDDLFIRFI